MFRWAAVAVVLLGCGARTGLDEGFDGAMPRPRPDGGALAIDAGSDPDLACPTGAERPGARCELDVERLCFYPRGAGLTACRCVSGRWMCSPAECDGWGSECFGSVHDDRCSGGLGCGACCALGGMPAVATWCACDTAGDRPECSSDVVCRGP